MIRCFVAFGLPREVRWRLEGAQAGLPVGRAVPPENLHVTVAFLGELPGPAVDDVHYALSDLALPGFSMAMDGVGLFGGRAPTSLYARVVPDPALAYLHRKVTQALRSAGVSPKAGRYIPHATLARFSAGGLRGEDAEAIQRFVANRLSLKIPAFEVEALTLFRSRLGKTARYEALAHYPLATGYAAYAEHGADDPAEAEGPGAG
ncbi:MAG: RNA 2',3'-cyclic phosphodiesterase [Pseudomonadota bacterium]